MKFETVNHHYLIHVDNHTALIDLGSPFSFSNEDTDITLGNKAHHIDASPGMIDQINNSDLLKESKVDMLIGLDIINQHCFKLDKVNGTCIVDDTETTSEGMHILPVKPLNLMGQGYTIAKAKFNGVEHDFILDTGAWIGYATSSVIAGKPEVGRVIDFSPIIGDIDTSKHFIDLEIAGTHDAEHPIGLMPGLLSAALSMIGIEIVMGIDDLVTGTIILDLPNSRVAFL